MRSGALELALGTALVLTVASPSVGADNGVHSGAWRTLEPGLELAAFEVSAAAQPSDASVHVLRIDPSRFALRLLNASAPGQTQPLTAKQWCARHGLVAAINASMYQTDYRTSVSLMRSADHTNNPRLSKDKAVLAFDPHDPSVPPVQIIDRQYQNFDDLSPRYRTLVQSIRMVSLHGSNTWQPQPQKWSTAAIGMDRQGRVLFVHVAAPFNTHDLINTLLALPLDMRNAMYVEGGPEAQLYVHTGVIENEYVGQFDAGIIGAANPHAWPIPNVVGVVRKE